MTGQQLRNSILQEAIHGRLVPNVLQPGELTARELLNDILAARQKAENEAKGKKAKKLTLNKIEEEPWELPEGWCWCRLGDVGQFVRGNGIKKDEVRTSGFPCVRYGELYTKYKGQFTKAISCVDEALFNKCQKIEHGDVLMALTGENEYDIALATVYLGEEQVAMGGDMTRLHPFVDSKYLVYAINSPYCIECKSHLATGQIIVHISNDKLASLLLPLPPLSIQHSIVSKIEALLPLVEAYDAAQGELKALNESLPDKLRKSVLQEAIHGRLVPNTLQPGELTARELLNDILAARQKTENETKGKKAKKLTLNKIEEEPWELPEGWCWCRLGDVYNFIDYRGKTPNKINEGITLITATNIKQGYLDFTSQSFISEEEFETRKSRGITQKGDILFTTEAPMGHIAINTLEKCSCGQRIITLQSYTDNLCNEMFCYLMQSPEFQSQIIKNASGMTATGIKGERAKLLLLPLPPLSIQHEIVSKIEEIFAVLDSF